ncbi:DUF805 domain-containing protein [Formicincola oecophyllae]|uniref:DUF805 domain-containing protein n=2 Tax=Formicincola oecophyllae TaxID=2558361 RepID=A0A4Y6UEP0_9PROT|nr:DUF805 domain-containing protein [Formicincola oecophyllae]
MLAFKNYAVFKGRAPRAEFWWFMLFMWIFILIAGGLDILFHWWGVLGSLVDLALILPHLAVSTRRLHDIGRSGWWLVVYWFFYVMLFGGVVVLVFNAKQIQAMFNQTAPENSGLIGVALFTGLIFLIYTVLDQVLLIFDCLPSQLGSNKYGPNPYGYGPAVKEQAFLTEAGPDVGIAPANQAPVLSPTQQAAQAQARAQQDMDALALLEKFADLRDKGVLTPEEFERKKEEILSKF